MNLFGRNLITTCQYGKEDELIKIVDDIKINNKIEIFVNCRDEHGWTPLICAACNGHLSVCKLLINELRAPVDDVTSDGWTALIWASSNGHIDVTAFLIGPEARADLNKATKNGITALICAAENGHEEMCELLLDNKALPGNVANIDQQDDAGWTPLIWAACNDYLCTCVYLIIRGAQVDLPNKIGWTALMYAASNGSTDVCACLLRNGANLNFMAPAEDERLRCTALMCAAEHGHLEVCQLFGRQENCWLSIRDHNGHTAENLAFNYGHFETAQFLKSLEKNE